MNNLRHLWKSALDSSRRSPGFSCDLDARLLDPIGTRLGSPEDWRFQNLAGPALKDEEILGILPPSVDGFMTDLQTIFDQYAANVRPYSWHDRIQSYLIKSYCMKSGIRLKKKNVINLISEGLVHEFIQVSQITILLQGEAPCAVFECYCPVEEYLGEYGLCFTKGREGLCYVALQTAWDLIANGGSL